jgi:hypothetical protein
MTGPVARREELNGERTVTWLRRPGVAVRGRGLATLATQAGTADAATA